MAWQLSDEDREFQEEVRTFLRDEYPEEIRYKRDHGIRLSREELVAWQKLLNSKGWFAVNWPVEHGGTGWSQRRKYLFASEMAAANVPGIIPFGVKMVGPVIYSFGNSAQKDRFLPDILTSDAWWCQGYSEPGAGSDLASLQTRAVLDGDHWVVNGTKTWTTLGQHADWIFCLVRSNTDVARRQEGISFLLIDMQSQGVTVRPIQTIDGGHEINEIALENVRVPVENLVGEEGKGWTYGKVLLQHERTNIAGVHESQYRLDRLRDKAREGVHGGKPLIDNRAFARKLEQVEIELKALEYTELRVLASVDTGGAPGPESSILKICGTEIAQAIDALLVEAAGYYALPYVPEQYDSGFPVDERIGYGEETASSLTYLNQRKVTIYGGSNEIQKNIISKHVLGL